MKIKNIKINKQRISALLGTLIICTTMTGCKDSDKKERYTIEENIITANKKGNFLVVEDNGQKLISLDDIRLADTKGNIIKKANVLVNNKIMEVKNTIDIYFGSDIDKVIIDNEMYDQDEFILVSEKDKKEIKNILGVFIDNEFITLGSSKGNSTITNKDGEVVEDEELTTAKFNALVEDIYNKLTNEGLPVSMDEVRKYVMIVNIDQLKEDNKELVNKIIGEQDVNEVILDTYSVISRIITENNIRWCENKLGWDQLLMYLTQDVVFSKIEKEKNEQLEQRTRKIAEAGRRGDKDSYNTLLNSLMMDMLDSKSDVFKLESGNGFNVMYMYFNFLRINFEREITNKNADIIKYFVAYAGDGIDVEENAKTSEYWRGINYLINECVKEKTR